MASVAAELPVPRPSVASRLGHVVVKAPVNLVLAVIGLLWLVPTIGLFLTSILPASVSGTEGWWKIFSHPSVATFATTARCSTTAG
jgi:hypothetical protein